MNAADCSTATGIPTAADSPIRRVLGAAPAPFDHASRARRWIALLAATPFPVALMVAALAMIGLLLAGAAPRVEVISMVLFVAFASYGVDRFVDRASEVGHSRGQGALVVAALACFALSATIALRLGGPWLAAGALAFPLSVVLYCVPWLAGVGWLRRRGIRRIKDIPYTKNVYTTLCLTGSIVWAAAASGAIEPARLLAALAVVFLIALVNVAACDLGDVEADARHGVPTFAIVFGRRRTARVLVVLAWAWAAALVAGFGAGAFPPSALWGALSVFATHAYLRRLARGGDVKLFADVIPDLAIGLTAGAMLVARTLGGG